MKIIDLLVKISKGEVLPIRFKYREHEYFLNDVNDYWCSDTRGWFSTEELATNNLNDEVEVIEEEKEIEKIEKIEKLSIGRNDYNLIINGSIMTSDKEEVLANKINELIDVINDMRDKE